MRRSGNRPPSQPFPLSPRMAAALAAVLVQPNCPAVAPLCASKTAAAGPTVEFQGQRSVGCKPPNNSGYKIERTKKHSPATHPTHTRCPTHCHTMPPGGCLPHGPWARLPIHHTQKNHGLWGGTAASVGSLPPPPPPPPRLRPGCFTITIFLPLLLCWLPACHTDHGGLQLSPPSRKDCILRCRQAQAGFQNGWLRRPLPPPPLLPPPVCVLAASLPHSPWGPHLSPPSRKDCILRCRQAQGTLLEWLAPPPAAAAAAAASAPGVCAGCQPAPQPMGAPPEPTVHERQRLQVHASSGRHPEWHCRRRCHCRRHRRRRRHRRCFRARSANLLSSHPSIQLAACSFRAPPTPCPAMPAPAPCHLTMLSSIVRCGQASRMAGTATRCRRHCRRRGRSRRLAHQPSTHSVGVLTLASTLAPLSAQDRQPDEAQTGLGWLRRRCDAAGVEAQPVCATASPRCLTCSQPASQPASQAE